MSGPQSEAQRTRAMKSRKQHPRPCFDPRDPSQRLTDRTTWKLTENAILISATMLFAARGDKSLISWEKVALLADLCEEDDTLAADQSERRHYATRHETDAMLRAALRRSDPGSISG